MTEKPQVKNNSGKKGIEVPKLIKNDLYRVKNKKKLIEWPEDHLKTMTCRAMDIFEWFNEQAKKKKFRELKEEKIIKDELNLGEKAPFLLRVQELIEDMGKTEIIDLEFASLGKKALMIDELNAFLDSNVPWRICSSRDLKEKVEIEECRDEVPYSLQTENDVRARARKDYFESMEDSQLKKEPESDVLKRYNARYRERFANAIRREETEFRKLHEEVNERWNLAYGKLLLQMKKIDEVIRETMQILDIPKSTEDMTLKDDDFIDVEKKVMELMKERKNYLMNLYDDVRTIQIDRCIKARKILEKYCSLHKKIAHSYTGPSAAVQYYIFKSEQYGEIILSDIRAYKELHLHHIMLMKQFKHSFKKKVDKYKIIQQEGESLKRKLSLPRRSADMDPADWMFPLKKESSKDISEGSSNVEIEGIMPSQGNWMTYLEEALTELDNAARNIIELFRTAVVQCYMGIMPDSYPHFEKDTQLIDYREVNLVEDTLFRPIDDAIEKCTTDTFELQRFYRRFSVHVGEHSEVFGDTDAGLRLFDDDKQQWTDSVSDMDASLKTTFDFLRNSTKLWDNHFGRLKQAKELVTSEAYKISMQSSKDVELHQEKLNQVLDNLRQGSSEEELTKILTQVQALLEEEKEMFKMAHNHEVIIIRNYKDIIDTDISLLKSELLNFLNRNPNEDVETYLINMLEAYASRVDSCVEVHKIMSKDGTEDAHIVRSKETSLGKIELEDDDPQLDFVICLKEKVEDEPDPPLINDLDNERDSCSIRKEQSIDIPSMLKTCELQVKVVMKWKKGLREGLVNYHGMCETELRENAASWIKNQIALSQQQLQWRLSILEPRYERICKEIYGVRLAELRLHNGRLERHRKGVQEQLSDVEVDLDRVIQEQKLAIEEVKNWIASAEKIAEIARTAPEVNTLLQKLESLCASAKEKLIGNIWQFQEEINKKLGWLRQSNMYFLKKVKLFSEDGNFSSVEAEYFTSAIQSISSSIDEVENSIVNDLRKFEDSAIQEIMSKRTEAEQIFSSIYQELRFGEQALAILSGVQRHIKRHAKYVRNTFYSLLQKNSEVLKTFSPPLTVNLLTVVPKYWLPFLAALEHYRDFLLYPDLKINMSIASAAQQSTPRKAPKKPSTIPIMKPSMFQHQPSDYYGFLSLVYKYMWNALKKLEEKGSAFYQSKGRFSSVHKPAILQPVYDSFMEEITAKFSNYLNQCKDFWLEEIQAFLEMVKRLKTAANFFSQLVLFQFHNCHQNALTEMHTLFIQDFMALHKKYMKCRTKMTEILKPALGCSVNKKLLEEVVQQAEKLYTSCQEKGAHHVAPYKKLLEDKLQEYNSESQTWYDTIQPLQTYLFEKAGFTNDLVEQAEIIQKQLQEPNVTVTSSIKSQSVHPSDGNGSIKGSEIATATESELDSNAQADKIAQPYCSSIDHMDLCLDNIKSYIEELWYKLPQEVIREESEITSQSSMAAAGDALRVSSQYDLMGTIELLRKDYGVQIQKCSQQADELVVLYEKAHHDWFLAWKLRLEKVKDVYKMYFRITTTS